MSAMRGKASAQAAGDPPFLPNFIIDAPAVHDELDGREPLAETMATALIGDRRIKFVGVIGEWGSGKSTVVEMLRRKLQAHDEAMLCFTYDAWLHQSDPPKRAFLEALVRFVREDERLKDIQLGTADWDDTLKALHRQVEVTEVITKPDLALSAKVVLPTLVFVPLGLKLLGDGVIAQAAQRDPWAIVMFVAGWLLALGPVFVVAGLYLAWRPWSQKTKLKAFWTEHRKPHQDQSILAVFANKPAEFKHEQKSRGPEPSMIEFQDMFRKIVDAIQNGATDKDPKTSENARRLVIILDNLDRVPDVERLVMWSTIRSFFLGSDYAGRPMTREHLPTVIMPVDNNTLGRLGGEKDDAEAAEAFSDKTFDLVFHVPPPVLSKWRDYLRAKLKTVFGGHLDPKWLHSIPVLYENAVRQARTGGGPVRINPRSLNVFVNALATQWLRWRGEGISLETIAYFVLAKVGSHGDIHGAVQIAQVQLEGFDPDWGPGLAALYYGVPKPQAKELFMEQPILEAIRLLDHDEFERLSALPAFDRYLIGILTIAGNGGNLGADPQQAATLLDRLESTEGQAAWRDHAWLLIRRALPIAIKTRPLDVNAIAITFKAAADSERRILLGQVREALSGLTGPDVERQQAPYRQAILFLNDEAQQLGLTEAPILAPSIPIFLELLNDPQLRAVQNTIDINATSEQITTHLATALNGGEPALALADAIAALASRAQRNFDWNPVLNSIFNALINNQPEWMAQCVNALWSLIQVLPGMFDTVSPHAKEGTLRNAVERLWNGEQPDAFAKGAALLLAHGGGLPRLTWDQILRQEPELGLWIAQYLDALPDFEMSNFHKHQHQWPQDQTMLRAIYTAWAEDRTLSSEDIETVLEHRPTYEGLLEPEALHKFWHRLDGTKGFHAALSVRPLEDIHAVASRIRGYDADHGSAVSDRRALVEVVQGSLDAVTQPTWSNLVVNGGEPYDLIVDFEDAVIPQALGQSLIDQAPSLALTGNRQHRERWFQLAEREGPELRWMIMQALAAAIFNAEPHELVELLDLGGAPLVEALAYPYGKSAFLTSIVISLLPSSRGRDALNYHRHVIANAVAAASSEDLKLLTQALKNLEFSAENILVGLEWLRALVVKD